MFMDRQRKENLPEEVEEMRRYEERWPPRASPSETGSSSHMWRERYGFALRGLRERVGSLLWRKDKDTESCFNSLSRCIFKGLTLNLYERRILNDSPLKY